MRQRSRARFKRTYDSPAVAIAEFDCDDERTGYTFRVLRAIDGDFYLSMMPTAEAMREERAESDAEVAAGRGRPEPRLHSVYGASTRVRSPMVGGGDQPELYAALVALFRLLDAPTEEKPQ